MGFITDNLLSLILFSPLVGGLLVLLLPGENKNLVRRAALAVSLVPFILTLVAWFGFSAAPEVAGFRFQQEVAWSPAINSSFHLGVDGLSLSMVLLTTLLAPLAILASFSVEEKIKPYMALFLALGTGLGTDVFPHRPMGQQDRRTRAVGWHESQRSPLCLFQVHGLHHGWLTGPVTRHPDARRGLRHL